jgi:hypothetical protein
MHLLALSFNNLRDFIDIVFHNSNKLHSFFPTPGQYSLITLLSQRNLARLCIRSAMAGIPGTQGLPLLDPVRTQIT